MAAIRPLRFWFSKGLLSRQHWLFGLICYLFLLNLILNRTSLLHSEVHLLGLSLLLPKAVLLNCWNQSLAVELMCLNLLGFVIRSLWLLLRISLHFHLPGGKGVLPSKSSSHVLQQFLQGIFWKKGYRQYRFNPVQFCVDWTSGGLLCYSSLNVYLVHMVVHVLGLANHGKSVSLMRLTLSCSLDPLS